MIRFVGLAATSVAIAALVQPPATAQARTTGSHRAAARATSPAYTAVAGRTSRYVVFNDKSNHNVYVATASGRAKERLFARNARATAVSGDLIEFVSGTTTHWDKIGTGRHGVVPASWHYLAPDGGLRIRHVGSRSYLDYLHLNGSTNTFALPAGLPTSGVGYSVVASSDGVAVAVNRAHQAPLLAFSNLRPPGTFGLLNRSGVARGMTLNCGGVSARSVGCLAGRHVFSFATNGRTAPQISVVSAAPLRVAVTDRYTSWTAPSVASSRYCPCTLASVAASGTAESIISHVTSRAVVAGSGRFYYSTGRTMRTAGVYSGVAAGSGTRIAAAPAR